MLTKLISLQLQLDSLDQTVEEEHRLAPGGVQLVPVHGDARKTTQTKAVDGPEMSRMPNVEGGVENICFLEFVQLGLVVTELAVQRPVLVLSQQKLLLVETVLLPVLLLLLLQPLPRTVLGLQLIVNLLVLLFKCLQFLDKLLLLQLERVQLCLELSEVAALLGLVVEEVEVLLVLVTVLLRLVQLLLQAVEHGVGALLTERMVHTAVVTQHVEERSRDPESLGHGAGLATLSHQSEPITVPCYAQSYSASDQHLLTSD